jgi:large subunit ribosomal protein L4
MLQVPVYDTDGKKVDTLEVDEASFGGAVNASLLKQAIVAYEANAHPRTAATKGRSMIAGSTKKLFRQKGTGYARRGNIRTNILRGGGVAFAKTPVKPRKKLSKKMRRAALNSALLAKIQGEDLMVVDGLKVDAPKTRVMAEMMSNLGINRSCLLTLAERDANVYLSGRNLRDLTIRTAGELNAFEVATRQKMLVTREAMQTLMSREGEK